MNYYLHFIIIDGLQIKDNNYFMIQKTHQQYPHLKSQHKPSCPLLSFGISKYQVIIDKINVDDVIASINICLALIDDFDFSFIEFEFMVSKCFMMNIMMMMMIMMIHWHLLLIIYHVYGHDHLSSIIIITFYH